MDQLPTFKSPPATPPSPGAVVLVASVAAILIAILCFTPIGNKVLLAADNAGADLLTRLGTKLNPSPDIVLLETNHIPHDPHSPSRALLATAIRTLHNAGAQSVGIDTALTSPSPSFPEGDQDLSLAAAEYINFAYFAAELSPTPHTPPAQPPGHTILALPDEGILPASAHPSALGITTLTPDRSDGVIRSVRHTFPVRHSPPQPNLPDQPELWPSLASRLASPLASPTLPATEPHRIRWTQSSSEHQYLPFPPLQLSALSDPVRWRDEFHNGAFFAGKKILISSSQHHLQQTPLGPTPTPQIQLCALNALLAGPRGIITSLPPAWQHAPLISGILVALAFFVLIRNPAHRTAATLVAAVLLLGLVWVLFNRSNILLPWTGMLFSLCCLSAVGIVTDITAQRAARAMMVQSLSRQTSPKLIRKVRRHPSPYRESLGGTRRPMSLLTVNLRDFADVVEPLTPEQSVTQLNKYLEHVNHCIFDNDGITSTSPGDSILASWGSLDAAPPATSAPRALDAARQIRRELDELNSFWKRRKLPPLKQGIALHAGECILGEIGPHNQRQLNVVGRTANTVRQIEALTRKFSSEILLSEAIRRLLPEDVQALMRPLPFIQIHGHPEALTLFDVLRSEKVDHWLSYRNDYLTGLKAFNDGDFHTAARRFDRCRSASPTDGLVTTMLEGAQGFVTRPPRKWKGVITLDKQ